MIGQREPTPPRLGAKRPAQLVGVNRGVVREGDEIGQIPIAGTQLDTPVGTRVTLQQRTDLVCDVVGDRVHPVRRVGYTRQLNRHERRCARGDAGHRQPGDEVDVKAREVGRAEKRDDGDPHSVGTLHHLPRGAERETEIVAEIDCGRLAQRSLGVGQAAVAPVEVHIEV